MELSRVKIVLLVNNSRANKNKFARELIYYKLCNMLHKKLYIKFQIKKEI